MSSLFFVHIPKTAGTSFRLGATNCFGERNVVRDYKEGVYETSAMINQHVYQAGDYWALYRAMIVSDTKMLCGHVPGVKYVAGTGVANMVTFVREPMQRLISEYQHALRHHDYKGSFRDFYSRPGKIDRQSKYLKNIPLPAVGFIGLTERYADSLQMINARYNVDIAPLEENTYRRVVELPHAIDPVDEQELRNLNKKDFKLYDYAVALFQQRKKLFDQGHPYAHCRLVDVSEKRIVVWAWWDKNTDEPVEIQVRINGQVIAEGRAQSYRSALARLSPPRLGYVGFVTPIQAKSGDSVDCIIAKTGQVFPPWPQVIP